MQKQDDSQKSTYLDKSGVAGMLGVTTRTVSAWMKAGHLPFFKIGSTVRFSAQDIERHLQANYRKGSAA